MKAYKGFDKDLKCRGFQYEVGKEYKEEKAEICNCGFHACENPMDVFGYYDPANSRYCEVDLDANGQRKSDSKRVGTQIKIVAEINMIGLIKAGVEYIKNQVDWDHANEFNTGDYSAATNTGYRSAATNTGYQSAATNTGNRSAATNTGNRSAATNTGDQSAATVEGKESIAIATGYQSRAKGSLGCFIVLAEWKEIDSEYHIVDVKSAKVDGEKVKADTFYKLVDGEFVEAE